MVRTDNVNTNETGIEKSVPSLDGGRIDKHNYLVTLLEEGVRVGIASESDIDRIKVDMVNALAEVIGYYTLNESSSVKTDTAKKLSGSLTYNIDSYLRSLHDDNAALETALNRKMSELYGKGYLINTQLYEKAKNLYGKVRMTRLAGGDEAYDKTIDRYFPYYLSIYSPKFSAHEKIYLSMPKYGIRGNFHINQAVKVLEKLLEINGGMKTDYIG